MQTSKFPNHEVRYVNLQVYMYITPHDACFMVPCIDVTPNVYTYTVEDHPKMTQLLEVMRIKDIGIAVKWFDLGLELVNDSNILQQIRDDDANTCCRMMFQKWLEKIPDASWNHLVAALNKIGMDSAANVVGEQFISGNI